MHRLLRKLTKPRSRRDLKTEVGTCVDCGCADLRIVAGTEMPKGDIVWVLVCRNCNRRKRWRESAENAAKRR